MLNFSSFRLQLDQHAVPLPNTLPAAVFASALTSFGFCQKFDPALTHRHYLLLFLLFFLFAQFPDSLPLLCALSLSLLKLAFQLPSKAHETKFEYACSQSIIHLLIDPRKCLLHRARG